MELDIFEGARGTGKSTLAYKIRQRTPETTLVNFTGFHADGEAGLLKVTNYYEAWFKYIFQMYNHDSRMVFDRFYFSESVYSDLYKKYDFLNIYLDLNEMLEQLSLLGVKINIFFLTINDKNELKERLTRDKVPFGAVEESVKETLKQQKYYSNLFEAFKYNYTVENLKLYEIDTSGKTNEEVYSEILQLKTAK